MNPFDLDATGLMVWGLVAHLIADWPLQNDWMANGKAYPWWRDEGPWSIASVWRDTAPGFVHATIHFVCLGIVFGSGPALALAVAHYLIDLRFPVAWWSRLMRQTQPSGDGFDVGLEVRFWTDQVFHIACIAVASLVVAA